MEKVFKQKKGITLIALVITIIVLLILAGISISMLSGDNSILSRAKESKTKSEDSQIEERIELAAGGAYTKGFGVIKYDDLVDELNHEFGEGNYMISPSGEIARTAEEWYITVGNVSKKISTKGIYDTTELDKLKVELAKQDGNCAIDEEGNIIPENIWNYKKTSENECELSSRHILFSGYNDDCACAQSNIDANGELINKIPVFIKEDGVIYRVTSIGKDAFREFHGLTKVTIPMGITLLNEYAFYKCGELENVEFSNSVERIGWMSFSQCNSLQSVVVPENVKSIEGYAFYQCTNLASITVPTNIADIGYRALEENIWWSNQPNGLVYAGKVAYKYKGTMSANTSININEGIKTIGYEAFKNYTGLKNVTIPNSVTKIEYGAFNGCTNLENVNIPSSVTSIGSYAFRNCKTFTSIEIHNGTISLEAFASCTNLKNIIIGEGVTHLGLEDWYGVGFDNCPNIENISVSANNPIFDSRNNCNAIIETSSNKLLLGCKNTTIPNSIEILYSGAFSNCKGLTSVIIPDGVKEIGAQVFAACTDLQSVTIPTSVNTIENDLFYNSNNLSNVYYKGTQSQWNLISVDSWGNDWITNGKLHFQE